MTLSSAEAELYSFAAISICRRSGIGRIRHVAVDQLRVQERLRRGDFALYKVRGDQKLADVLTKHVPRETLDRHLRTLGLTRAEGRVVSAPHAQLGPAADVLVSRSGHQQERQKQNTLGGAQTNPSTVWVLYIYIYILSS